MTPEELHGLKNAAFKRMAQEEKAERVIGLAVAFLVVGVAVLLLWLFRDELLKFGKTLPTTTTTTTQQ